MPHLIFVRHSETQPVPGTIADEWQLSPIGHERCYRLAEQLRRYPIAAIASSTKQKTIQTAQRLSEVLHSSTFTVDGLQEHDRSNTTTFHGKEEFQQIIRQLFDKPDQLVYGTETANQAHERFASAVTHLLTNHPDQTLAAVTHGTVLALYISRLLNIEPFSFWEQLGMPAYIVLSLPDLKIVETVMKIA